MSALPIYLPATSSLSSIPCRNRAIHVFARNPLVHLALALILTIWVGAAWQVSFEAAMDRKDTASDAVNLARIISQNVERTANSLDATLKDVRSAYERSGHVANWPSLIADAHTNSGMTVQIAAIDRSGKMISSSSMLHPTSVIDLSDRQHFKALKAADEDILFISHPMVGRASKQRTVQFARRVYNQERMFDGIIVASLTTDYLTHVLSDVALGSDSGIALFGSDGVIRAGSGLFADTDGKAIADVQVDSFPERSTTPSLGAIATLGSLKAVATSSVAGHPLRVRVVLNNKAAASKLRARVLLFYSGAAIASFIIIYFVVTSILNREKYEARVSRLANFDNLTDLPNRFHFNNALKAAHAEAQAGRVFALMVVDLDGFKHVNDTYGHPFGDRLLRAVAKRIQHNIRGTDVCARLGGDEFAIIQKDINNQDDVAALARHICNVVGMPFQIDNYNISIGASIGVVLSSDAANGENLLKLADLALYEAKSAGRGTFRFFNADIELAYENRRALERDIKIALQEKQFELYYQPIIDIATGRTREYEALIRWHHPSKGMIAPNHFIPVAEETGLILELGDWIIREACQHIAQCADTVSVAVNCSTLQFRSAGFVDTVRSALEKTGLEPHRLDLEVTESIFMERDSAAIARMHELRTLGVALSLDDFGTGYSSLSYVLSYPFRTLKIDRAFTSQLCVDTRGASVVRAICSLASSLGMATVAEGVEDEQQLEMLRSLGCTRAQGYYFSRPKPAREILGLAA